MRALKLGMALGLWGFLVGGVAAADPLGDQAMALAKQNAPQGKPAGNVLQGGGEKTDWNIDLENGKCYTFAGVAQAGAKVLYLYLWDPGDHRVAYEKPHEPQVILRHCTALAGRYHIQAKTDGGFMYRVAYVAGPPQPAAPPPTAGSKPSGGGPLAPSLPCRDDAGNGQGSLVVSCDGCGAMAMWLDGEMVQVSQGATSWRIDGAAAGCHTLKVEAWTGLFSHNTWYNGKVRVLPNMEVRYQSRAGVFEEIGKSKIAPPAPQISADAIDDAKDYVKDAIDTNSDADSDCSGKVGGKLEAVSDLLDDLKQGQGDLDKTVRKLQEAIAYADDNCPRRLAGNLDKKLNKALRRLSPSN